MGKRKDTSTEEEINVDVTEQSPHKKHKKHKHKKHKKKKSHEDGDGSPDILLEDGDPLKPALKLKIKIGKETFGEKNVGRSDSPDKAKEKLTPSKSGEKTSSNTASPKSSSKSKKKGKGKDSGTSSEEERWLDAIESGKLEEVDDELKKMKDPKLMTARQRAMFEKKTEKEPSPGTEQLVALPSGYKEEVLTEEMLQKKALKSQKRRQLAEEKREKDKKKTMDRLLRKKESKAAKLNRPRSARKHTPRVTYRNVLDGITISLPQGVEFPLRLQKATAPKPISLCGVLGCSNPKKYTCSRSGIPLCSFTCYKVNMLKQENLGRGS